MVGEKFGRLTVKALAPDKEANGGLRWVCLCDCGKEITTAAYRLRNGKAKSCGCYRSGVHRHGKSGTSVYTTWTNMLQRCADPNYWSYANYGGRGINVCERWMSFDNFYADMGDKPPGMSLERIENDKGYSPENCRWIPVEDQAKNRRGNVFIEYNGEYKSLKEWAKVFGIEYATAYARLRSGLSLDDVLRPGKLKTGPKKLAASCPGFHLPTAL